jgi:hypothetical protein
MVIALNKLTKKEEDGNETIITNLDFNIGSNGSSDISIPSDGKDGKEVSVSRNEVGEEREETPKEEVEEVIEEIKEEPKERGDVEFIPTDEEARKLYGELPTKKKKSGKLKHTYITAQRRGK